MTETQQLLATAKRLLKARGLTYRDVGHRLELSEPSVKRLLSTGNISLGRLAALCAMLDLTLAELAREAADSVPRIQKLSHEQEAELVSDPRLLMVAVCALNHWSVADIVARYRLSEAECLKHLLRLDRMRLIDLLPGNRIRINVARDFDWLPDGPIRRYFRERGQDDFIAGAFDHDDEGLYFVHGMLTNEARSQILGQLRLLKKRFAALHDECLREPIGQRRGTGLLLALREWEAPDFSALRK